MAITGKLSTI